MNSSKDLSPRVWVSEVAKSVENIFPIGKGFSPDVLDYPEYYSLFWKKKSSQWKGSTVVFTDEEQKRLKQLNDKALELEEFYRNFEKLPVLPEKLWYGLLPMGQDRFPRENDFIFKVRGGALVVTEACAQVLQAFRLGGFRSLFVSPSVY